MFERYLPLKNKISTAEVVRVTDSYVDIRIGKLETKLPDKEMIPGETFNKGDLIKVYIKIFKVHPKGQE